MARPRPQPCLLGRVCANSLPLQCKTLVKKPWPLPIQARTRLGNHALEKCPWHGLGTQRAGTGWGSLRQSLMVRATLNMHHRSWRPRQLPLGARRWSMAGYHLLAPCWRPCRTIQRLVATLVQRLVATMLAASARHHLGTQVRGTVLPAGTAPCGERSSPRRLDCLRPWDLVPRLTLISTCHQCLRTP